ncbi:MAG: hypothetical protein L0332_23600 [Chloroflexi bacterium]|nr:hypothetical protein [Chloroflexota bacterium]MCI0578690.1 hypothetical protein [Chloroflexota bacterium]MCI0648350.1 hypothetical protein [Chloroflexota bacterium]MCI0729678.1 hypothetical protein [Chloroflexota bacterium]
MHRLSRLTLLFAVLFAVFIILPGLLSQQLGLFPLIKVGDVLDVFTPLVLIPIYWLLYWGSREAAPGSRATLLFLVLIAMWAEGQGMHLSANSIGHLLQETRPNDPYELTHFYDEVLSHYLWHTAVIGLSVLIAGRHWRQPVPGEQRDGRLEIPAAVIYGLTYFIVVIEGGTAPLGVPFAVLAAVVGLVWGRRAIKERPVLLFFLVAYVLATVVFAGWALYWGGLPQFSEVGIIE